PLQQSSAEFRFALHSRLRGPAVSQALLGLERRVNHAFVYFLAQRLVEAYAEWWPASSRLAAASPEKHGRPDENPADQASRVTSSNTVSYRELSLFNH